ncbi:MAG TPA: hypothetical protein VK911_11900 [Vicinamibacterales bacterium]|nr:hypothetical protein [Vicinamibacterales bacterium]
MRGLDPTAVRILAAAAEGSPTVRAMLDRLEASDLIVYVKFVPRVDRPRAVTGILAAVPEARYVLISITTFAGEADHFLLLGHELQHAVELADAPDVRDNPSMSRLYERIGWRESPLVYETPEAQEAGRVVQREMWARRSRPDELVASSR